MKTETMASGPITSWQIDGETMETVTDFIFIFLINYLTTNIWVYFVPLMSVL